MAAEPPVLSVVVPLFNEQDSVEELTRRIVETCRRIKASFELIAVNDGSRDETMPRLIRLSRSIPEMRVIDLFRNFGHMPALSAGIALSRGQAVVVMDGDLQDTPELIRELFAEWRSGAEVVYGLRTRRGESFLKRRATGLFYWLLGKITETPIPEQAGTFSLMDRRVVDILNGMPERDRYFAGLRAWAGGRQAFVTYERPDRIHGRSRVGMPGLLRLARTALVSFSKVPLRYASGLSLACGLILFLIGLTAILIRLFTKLAIPGWATTTALIGMMGFVQSVVLAVISEYVAVIFDEVKARPLFLVRQEFAGGEAVRPREPQLNREWVP
ncbi:MAG: glycosyltransferase family 2 protein [Candidatus Omnitrophica bacterium]|nr:glycosyltransferase family 2 protein [Candidatus Omnitrophota bacterium]